MIVRIAEIQVDPANLDEYLERARTIGADSVANEPGVIAIFPMQDKRNPGQIRILEIYADEGSVPRAFADASFPDVQDFNTEHG